MAIPDTTREQPGLAPLIDRFVARYESFESDAYRADERDYKLEASRKLREILNRERMATHIERGDWAAAKEDIKRAMRGNNLLNQWDVLAVTEAPDEPLARALFDLLHGDGPFERRFDAWVRVLTHRSQGVWPAATYFLMLQNPESDVFIKPRQFQTLLRALGRSHEWPTRPNARYYNELRDLAYLLLNRLRPLGAQDMIDVQSFLWFVTQPERVISVPRLTGEDAARVYAAAERWVDAALRRDDSLFTPGRAIWTAGNIEELHRRFVLDRDTSDEPFMTKLQRQLAGADPGVYQFTTELLYVHVLSAYRATIGGPKKRELIQNVLSWSPEPIAIPADLDAALDNGLASMGQGFNQDRPSLLRFLIAFARAWKQLSAAEQARLLDDPWAFKQMVWNLPAKSASSQREILLHLVHPDTFEPIASANHKQRIARAFAHLVTEPTDDIDRRLWQIRQRLAQTYGVDFDWYETKPVYEKWSDGKGVDPIQSELLFESLGTDPRAYARLAVRLSAPSYAPEEIVELVGRIHPPLADLAAAPDADALVADLSLLRFLEPLADGRYRRWAHLADATEDLYLRYAALTLLVPVAGEPDVYELPILNAPSKPTPAWPGGEAVRRWYEAAGLAEETPDGWQLTADALRPVDDSTPTGRAINTFLAHLERARMTQAATAGDSLDGLPVLDPATLEARIAEIQRELLIDRQTILRIYRSLIAGRHVILSGPPGTGKTHLARILPRILWRETSPARLRLPDRPELSPIAAPREELETRHGYDVEVVTATEDWGVRHVIGGIAPQVQRNGESRALVYSVRHGYLTRVVLQNYGGDGESLPATTPARRPVSGANATYRGRWLVIDEFTRAPIDAAFGSLLTTLGGQGRPVLKVPTDDGAERELPLPADFRLIGTLNSFDRHFLNQISEAMKRRFTFIDVLPPDPDLADAERGMAIYRALLSLAPQRIPGISADPDAGTAAWEGVLDVRREETPDDSRARVRYVATFRDAEAERAFDSCWRVFAAIRVYRLLGTAQAEAVYATLVAGRAIELDWPLALDSALADVLADQLQVLARDELRALLAFLEHAGAPEELARRMQRILAEIPLARLTAHLAQLRGAGATIAEDAAPNTITAEQLPPPLRASESVIIDRHGIFGRRLESFVSERGL